MWHRVDREVDERKDKQTEQQEGSVIERIAKNAENIEIPESLQPEAVERRLEKNRRERLHRRRKKWGTVCSAAAACVCVLIGIAAAQNGWFTEKDRGKLSIGIDTEYAAAKSSTGKIVSATDYDEVYAYIKEERKAQEEQLNERADSVSKSTNESAVESASDSAGQPYAGQGEQSAADSGYSDTNVREAAVGEGDIVKTDGKNLYILEGQNVQIVSIEGEKMVQTASIRMDKEKTAYELYIEGNSLLIAYSVSGYADGAVLSDEAYANSDTYNTEYREYTAIDIYDVSIPSAPKLLDTFSQSGSFYTMRVSDGYVYLLSNFYADIAAGREEIEAYIPKIQGENIESSKILLPQYKRGTQYTVLSAFVIAEPSGKTDSIAVFGSVGTCYVSRENIYICEGYYNAQEETMTQTCIRKIGYQDGILEAKGQTKIDGTLNDSFSIDEYEGNLRLVTTVSPVGNSVAPLARSGETAAAESSFKESNSLYVLDENLEIIGEIHDLAQEEQIYSARFIGKTGYFVTYRQTDPLFSVDLSDPSKPQIIGELKIPGFSEYLHPFGEGKLLGIGMDVDETGTVTNGVKLSMFDISDASDVKEVQKYVLEDMYSTDVAYNYKAALISEELNLIGFTAYGQRQTFYMFSYDNEKGFTMRFSRELSGYGEARGIYSDSRFYLVSGNTVEVYTLDTFDKIDDIVL